MKKAEDLAERVIQAAKKHGEESDPDYEVGDLQQALRAMSIFVADKYAGELEDELSSILSWDAEE